MSKKHQLHERIGTLIHNFLNSEFPDCKIVKSPECQKENKKGNKLSLYCSKEKGNATKYCDVDLLILKGDTIKVIVEIEESDITPIRIFGKFLASALSSYSKSNEMDTSVTFIQILDTSSFAKKENSSKPNQFEKIKKSIQGIPKFSKIKCYKIFYGNKSEFEGEKGTELINFIQKAIEGENDLCNQ